MELLEVTTTPLTRRMNATTAAPPAELTVVGWYTLCMSVSAFGSLMLILLLTTVCRGAHGKLSGSGVLIVHLMAIQLLHCAVFFPILFTDSFTALMPGVEGLHLNCPVFLLLHIGTIQTEHWASLVLALNR